MVLQERLKETRLLRGLSQRQLAKILDIPQAHISRIESGSIQHIRSDLLFLIAQALHVTSDYLIGLAQEPTRYRRKAS